MESANEKKEHWLLLDVNKFINSIDLTSLDNDNILLLKELLTQYNELVLTQKELELRIEKNMRIQKRIILGFFSLFIIVTSYMTYISGEYLDPVRLFFIFTLIVTAAYIYRLTPGP